MIPLIDISIQVRVWIELLGNISFLMATTDRSTGDGSNMIYGSIRIGRVNIILLNRRSMALGVILPGVPRRPGMIRGLGVRSGDSGVRSGRSPGPQP